MIKRRGLLFHAVLAAVFFGLVILLQLRTGAYRSEFGAYPDESAHYVTGLAAHDYLASGHFTQAEPYLKNYYLHYPKVAIGHWPPFFYLVQGLWMFIFPTSRVSLLLLMASFTVVSCIALYRVLRREISEIGTICASLLLICIPLIQESNSMVMSDALVGTLGLLAVLSFAEFVESLKPRYAVWFGVLSAAAILTKGTGLALAGIPLITLAVTNRWKLLLRPAFWLPVAIVVPLCAPWYWITRHMLQSTGEHPKSAFNYIETAVWYYLRHSFSNLGLLLFAFAVCGFFVTVVVRRRNSVSARWAGLAALLISTALLACVVPVLPIGGQTQVMGAEERFLVPAMPAIIAFSFAGIEFLAPKLAAARLNTSLARGLMILFAAVMLVPYILARPVHLSFGFARVSNYLISQPDLSKAVIMISSDAVGEGMLISEIATQEQRPGHYVVRGSKVLCDCSWSGEEHSPVYATPEALMGFLRNSPVQVVVYDESASPESAFESHTVLARTIEQYPSSWKMLGQFPITRDGVVYQSAIKVYQVLGTNPHAPLQINMRRMLDSNLVLKP